MINLLHRYILKELLISIGISFGFFVLLLILGNAFKDLAEMLTAGKLGFQLFCQLILLLIPAVSIYAIPLAVLSGTLIAFGRLSSDSEITAMKSVGVSLYQIAAPVFFIAFMGMLISAVVTLQLGPKSIVTYKSLIGKAITENPLGFIQEKKFIKDFPGYIIYLNERVDSKLKDFWIWELDEQNHVEVFLRSESGQLTYDSQSNAIILNLENGSVERRSISNNNTISVDSPKILYFESMPIELPLSNIFWGNISKPLKYKNMTFAQLMAERKRILVEEAKTGEGFSVKRGQLQLYIQQNLSQAYSIIAMGIIAIPLAIRVGRKESYVNAMIALLVALLYHLLFIYMSWFDGIPGVRSDLLIWLPNIIFQSLGLWLFAKAVNR